MTESNITNQEEVAWLQQVANSLSGVCGILESEIQPDSDFDGLPALRLVLDGWLSDSGLSFPAAPAGYIVGTAWGYTYDEEWRTLWVYLEEPVS